MNATTTKARTESYPKYELLYCSLDRKYVRFLRNEGSFVVVCDRNTLKELPDFRHPTQVRRA